MLTRVTRPLVLLDAASLYFRSFHALPESLTSEDGTPVNAVRGFADTVARVLTDRCPSRLVACLDADWRPQFRVELLPSYKTHRVPTDPENDDDSPDALAAQVPIILELLEAAGLATAEAVGYEADDVIGTLTTIESTAPVEIVTGDRDLFQLVRTQPSAASVHYVGKGWNKADTFGPAEISAQYGLPETTAGPAYADMAALRGDPSDGLPGVPGIGDKTAARLISRFGSLEALLSAAEQGSGEIPTKTRTRLCEAAEYLTVAPGVVRVVRNAPVALSKDDRVPTTVADPERLTQLQQRWNLGGSVDRLRRAVDSDPAA